MRAALGNRDKSRAQREEEQAESHLDEAKQGQVAQIRSAHLADMGEGGEHDEHEDLRQARRRGHGHVGLPRNPRPWRRPGPGSHRAAHHPAKERGHERDQRLNHQDVRDRGVIERGL